MRLRVVLSGLVLSAVCISSPLQAQHPSLSTSSSPTRRALPGLPGRSAKGSSAAEPLSTTPHWSSNFRFTHDTGLEAQSAVYDQATTTMVVFAGLDINGFGDTNAVLLYAPANGDGRWSTLIANGAPGSPPARDAHTAVYDSANNRMIAFGGEFFSDGTTLNDVWVLTNANGQGGTATWTQLSPSGSPPPARLLHTAVYDAANNVMTVFGGFDNNGQDLSDVWVLSHANGLGGTPAWTQLSPTGAPPSEPAGSSAVYDPNNNIMTVFAGVSGAACIADGNGVWTLSHANGQGGTPQWTNIVANGAAGAPAKRESPTAVYDVANNRMIIFGGGPCVVGAFNDVWVLTSANGLGGTPTWIKLKASGKFRPGTRFFHTAVYDAVNNDMMIFGGDNDEAIFFVTWVLTHANGL